MAQYMNQFNGVPPVNQVPLQIAKQYQPPSTGNDGQTKPAEQHQSLTNGIGRVAPPLMAPPINQQHLPQFPAQRQQSSPNVFQPVHPIPSSHQPPQQQQQQPPLQQTSYVPNRPVVSTGSQLPTNPNHTLSNSMTNLSLKNGAYSSTENLNPSQKITSLGNAAFPQGPPLYGGLPTNNHQQQQPLPPQHKQQQLQQQPSQQMQQQPQSTAINGPSLLSQSTPQLNHQQQYLPKQQQAPMQLPQQLPPSIPQHQHRPMQPPQALQQQQQQQQQQRPLLQQQQQQQQQLQQPPPPQQQQSQPPPQQQAPPQMQPHQWNNQLPSSSVAQPPGPRSMYPNAMPPSNVYHHEMQPQTYPQQPSYQQQQQQPNNHQHQPLQAAYNGQQQHLQYQNQNLSVTQQGFNRLWGHDTLDLMQHRHILPPGRIVPPAVSLGQPFNEAVNCSPDVFRCTLNKVPESNSLLQKSRLPFGVLIHPFRDLNNLPVIQCATIVRCRACRTYINPFVYFVDSKKWKCNLCYRVNELPEEFQYDPVSKSYGDVTRRPEIKSSTIEFIAPSEYMLRPPQPAIYLFLLDVSMIAMQSGYLNVVCESLAEHLDELPGDARTQVGFIAYNSGVHFYSISSDFNQPHEITIVDIEDVFLPFPDNLLINLKECKDQIKDLLTQLPKRFANSMDSNSALGAALQVAFQLMSATGGRVSVFQTCLPNIGPGALQARENPNNRSSKDVLHLGPAIDYYKRLALECSGQQIAVDMFLLNSQYTDLATISGISKFSGGCIHHFPLFNAAKQQQVLLFKRSLERYLMRKIGLEAVMRVRCTRGLAIHTFHGNFFVRSTDLLSLPNVNPDAGFGMQISYDESLTELKTVCFQAALLYTSSKGERRIRVHTLCLPVTNSLTDVIRSADTQCIIGMLAKMAVDRSLQTNMSDARDAFINATVDIFSAYKLAQNLPQGVNQQLMISSNLSLLPLYTLALLKHVAFRTGTSTRLDDRVFAMCEMKSLPLDQLIRYIYPDFYQLDCLFCSNKQNGNTGDGELEPPKLQLSAEKLDSRSIFMLDSGNSLLILVGTNVPLNVLKSVFGVNSVNEIPEPCFELPSHETPELDRLHSFLESINEEKPFAPTIQIIRDTSTCRQMITERLVDDKSESHLSYYEFLQHLRTQLK